MKNKLLRIFTAALVAALLLCVGTVSVFAEATGNTVAPAVTAADGVIVGILVLLITLFMAALVFLGVVFMKTRKK